MKRETLDNESYMDLWRFLRDKYSWLGLRSPVNCALITSLFWTYNSLVIAW